MTDQRRLELLHDLTANYSDRQGLRIVPIGIAVLLQAVPDPWEVFGMDLHLLALVAGVFFYDVIGRFYARRFGEVQELPYPGPPVLLQATLVLLLLLLAMGVDIVAQPPVFVSGLLIALWVILVAWPARSVRGQYVGIGILLALTSMLPLAGLASETVAMTYGVVFGLALVVSGIADHILFIRLLGEPAHE